MSTKTIHIHGRIAAYSSNSTDEVRAQVEPQIKWLASLGLNVNRISAGQDLRIMENSMVVEVVDVDKEGRRKLLFQNNEVYPAYSYVTVEVTHQPEAFGVTYTIEEEDSEDQTDDQA
jgi:hypothetical protein